MTAAPDQFTWTLVDYSVDGTARSVTIVDATELPDGTVEAAASTVTDDGVKAATTTGHTLEEIWERLAPPPGHDTHDRKR